MKYIQKNLFIFLSFSIQDVLKFYLNDLGYIGCHSTEYNQVCEPRSKCSEVNIKVHRDTITIDHFYFWFISVF